MNSAALLQCTDVCKAFPKPDGAELLVLEGMNLELREGQIVGLLGRSGSGKSTLLRVTCAIWANRFPARRRASPWYFRALRCFHG
jgi:NitT/TauT family transport system ATP-binding protein